MKFEINPYIGAGDILLGMTSEQIQNIIGIVPTKFKKVDTSKMYTDAYEWFHVYYNDKGKCEAIEIFEPSMPVFKGQYLINRPFIEVKKYFDTIDDSIEINDAGFTSFKYGISIYAPFAEDEPFEPVESISIFEYGYFE
ncbi:MAG: hypothetical protein E7211_12770 [Clostridium lundense]|nr:hypothetical protein [Clostridium lundense]